MSWKRILGWAAGIISLLIVIVIVAGYLTLRSERFHNFVLSKVVQKASEATGGKVQIQGYEFHPSELTANVYGIVVHGTEPSDQAPLVAIDRLTLRLKILSVLHQQVNLSELTISHPVLHLTVDSKGNLNIPSPSAPKDTSSQTNVFDLAVGHVGLNNGEIYYNDARTPLSADLHDLKTDVRFEALNKRYAGSIAYDQGSLQYGKYKPLPHAMQAQFAFTPSEAFLSSLQLKIGNSQAALEANVKNYSNPQAVGSYRLRIHPEDFADMIPSASATGDVMLSGKMHYETSRQTLLKNVVLDGNLEAEKLRISSPQGVLNLSAVRGQYELANGNLAVRPLTTNLLGGKLLADLTLQHLDSTPATQIRARLDGVSLAAVKQSLRGDALKNLPVTGVLLATADASWVGDISDIKATSHLKVKGKIHGDPGDADVPLNLNAHASYNGRDQRISLRDTRINTPESWITAQGDISRDSNLAVQAHTSNLAEITRLASVFQAPGAKPVRASGTANLNALVRGPLQSPTVAGQLDGQNLEVEGSSWRSVQAGFRASPSQAVLDNASLVSTREGRINARASVGLKRWSYQPSSPLSANVTVRQMPVADLQRLARINYPVSGTLSGDLTLHGSQLNPIGNGTLQLNKAEAYNQPFQNLTVKFQGTGDEVHSTLAITTPAGNANGSLTYAPNARTYQVEFKAPDIVVQQLQAVQAKNLQVQGRLSITAQGSGSVDNPQLLASLQVPQLQFRETTISGIKADLNVANHVATFVMGSGVSNASVKANARINLTGDYYAEAAIDTTKIALDPLLVVYVSNFPTGGQAQIELHASMKGPLKDKSRIDAHVEVPTLEASYQQLQIGNAGPIRIDFSKSLITIQPSELKGTETSLRIQGHVPVQDQRPMDLTAQGQINLKLLKILTPDVQSAGLVNLDLRGTGNFNKPGVLGQIRLQNVALTTSDSPLGVEKLNGILDVANGQVRVTQLQGQSGGGQISGSGTVIYEPKVQFNVALDAKNVRLRYPAGVRSAFDGTLALTGTPQAASINGQVLVDSLSFTPDFDLASVAAQASTPSLPPANPTFADNLKLNVSVQTAEDLSAASSTVSIEGDINLRVIGTAANPVIVGRTDLTSGDIFFAGQRYQLERGLINFINPSQTQPYLNVLITTTIQQYNLNLSIVGPIEKLETKYTSDPPLPPVDIINLIARGQTTEESVPGNFSANQVLAQGLASQVSSRIGKLAGISSLTIDPNLGGNNENPSARVAIQQRVTKNFIFTFSTDVTQPQSEIVEGEYQINKRWSVSASRDQYGGFAFDGKYHTNF